MIANRPVVICDTSVHNRMHRGGAASNDIFAALNVGYFVRIAGLSIEELFATPDAAERANVLAFANRLQAGPSDCLLPQNEMLRIGSGSRLQSVCPVFACFSDRFPVRETVLERDPVRSLSLSQCIPPQLR
jgi:hypothetical protein